jgi:ubiquinone/menaquinone biosynthesis C-methylase UbiE
MDVQEFDKFADEYSVLHARAVAASGYGSDFFAEYKIRDMAEQLQREGKRPRTILDFGSGVGNSIPYFRKYFPDSLLTCGDVSSRSLEVSRTRFPGAETHALIAGDRLPFPDASFDAVFSACVFHHIAHDEHAHWLRELQRVAAAAGRLFIFEHNPWNPLTAAAVRNCPFDENARLIDGRSFARRVAQTGWSDVAVRYRIFFPRMLAILRAVEPHISFLPLGAQYYVSGRKAQ